eukprot:1195898-Prorocentrum_minimum.AAC.3
MIFDGATFTDAGVPTTYAVDTAATVQPGRCIWQHHSATRAMHMATPQCDQGDASSNTTVQPG